MRLPQLSRPFAAITLLLAFAAPGTSVAHGFAHERAHETVAHHVTDATPANELELPADADHEHPRIDEALRVRGHSAPAQVSVAALLAPLLRVVPCPTVRWLRTNPAIGDRDTGPPPSLRAPPLS